MKQFYSASAWSVFKRKLKQRFHHLTDADLVGIEAEEGIGCERSTMLERLQRLAGRSALEIARLAEEAAEESSPHSRRLMISAKEKLLGPIWLGGTTPDRTGTSAA